MLERRMQITLIVRVALVGVRSPKPSSCFRGEHRYKMHCDPILEIPRSTPLSGVLKTKLQLGNKNRIIDQMVLSRLSRRNIWGIGRLAAVQDTHSLATSRSSIVAGMKTVSKKQERSSRIKETHHHLSQLIVLDGLGDVVIEPGLRSILNLIGHCIGRQGHDGNLGIVVFLLPSTDIPTGIVPILHGHLDVALQMKPVSVDYQLRER